MMMLSSQTQAPTYVQVLSAHTFIASLALGIDLQGILQLSEDYTVHLKCMNS